MRSFDYSFLYAKYAPYVPNVHEKEFEKRMRELVKYGGCYVFIAWQLELGSLIALRSLIEPHSKHMCGILPPLYPPRRIEDSNVDQDTDRSWDRKINPKKTDFNVTVRGPDKKSLRRVMGVEPRIDGHRNVKKRLELTPPLYQSSSTTGNVLKGINSMCDESFNMNFSYTCRDEKYLSRYSSAPIIYSEPALSKGSHLPPSPSQSNHVPPTRPMSIPYPSSTDGQFTSAANMISPPLYPQNTFHARQNPLPSITCLTTETMKSQKSYYPPASFDINDGLPPTPSRAVSSALLDGTTELEESSAIKCICNFPDDDGNTVLCEKCDTWQHIMCYYESSEHVPDVHERSDCNPRSLNSKAARRKQRQRRKIYDEGNKTYQQNTVVSDAEEGYRSDCDKDPIVKVMITQDKMDGVRFGSRRKLLYTRGFCRKMLDRESHHVAKTMPGSKAEWRMSSGLFEYLDPRSFSHRESQLHRTRNQNVQETPASSSIHGGPEFN